MGKYVIIILLTLVSFGAYAQYPSIQSIGTDSSLVTAKGGFKGRLVNTPFTDTTQANLQRIKYYNGAQIVTYVGGAKFWIRDSALMKWIQITGGGGGGSGDVHLDTTYRRADTVFGVKDGVELVQWIFSSDSAETYQWSVIDSLSVPPTTVFEGDKYLVGTSPTGAFAGHANEIATYNGTIYTFETATTGDLLYNATLAVVDKFNGSTWTRLVTPTNVNWWTRLNEFNVSGQFARIGVNTYSSLQPTATSYGYKTFLANPNGTAGSTAFGAYALHHNSILGYNNTAIGDRAMWYTNSGHDNVAVGKNAMSASGNVNYSIALGTNSVGENNTLAISSFVTKMRMYLDSAIGTPYSIVGVDALGNWRRYATPSGGGGSGSGLIDYGTNVGGEAEVFKDSLSRALRYRTLYGANGVLVSQETDKVKFEVDSTKYATKFNLDSTRNGIRADLNGKLSNITGLVTAGTNATVTGSGTIGSPYVVGTNGVASVITRGTFAQRPASPDTGQIYEQTDRLAGTWKYDGASWNFNGDPLKFNYFEQFANSTINVPRIGGLNGGTGSGGGVAEIVGLGSYGAVTTGTTTTGYTSYGFPSAGTQVLTVDSMIQYQEQRIMLPVLSDATDSYTAAVGWLGHQNTWTFASTIFIYNHNNNSGKWETRTRKYDNSGNMTYKDTGVPVVAGQWYKLGIEINGYTKVINFYIDDVLVTTHSTAGGDNIPMPGNTAVSSQYNFGIAKAAGTTARLMYIDYSLLYFIKKKYQ